MYMKHCESFKVYFDTKWMGYGNSQFLNLILKASDIENRNSLMSILTNYKEEKLFQNKIGEMKINKRPT